MTQNKLQLIKEPKKGHTLRHLPKMVGITADTRRFLSWKSLKWMFLKDHDKKIMKAFFKHPIKYSYHLLKSFFTKKQYTRDDDFFLYGIETVKCFEKLIKDENTLFVTGFSYCQKPFECPSLRFTSDCINDPNDPVCQQCFIGKVKNALPEKGLCLIIPTIHYISGELLELIEKNPKKQIVFLITACELTLEMFGIWGKMADLKGIGVRLDGRICNTMKAFELSEMGIKPGLTKLLDRTELRVLALCSKTSPGKLQ
jgi:hypothetical protein